LPPHPPVPLPENIVRARARTARASGGAANVGANWLQMVASYKRKSGQAPALSVKNWGLWLKWLLKTAGPRIYFVVMLTGAFGLRCSEAIALKREDICLDGDLPRIKVTGDTAGARKSPGDVYVRKQHLKLMQDHLKNGIRTDRQQGHKHGKGKKKLICKKDVFHVPLAGYIFTARKNSKVGHLHYHAVYDHIVKQAPKFYKHLRDSGDVHEDIDDHCLHSANMSNTVRRSWAWTHGVIFGMDLCLAWTRGLTLAEILMVIYVLHVR
jgi:integrase